MQTTIIRKELVLPKNIASNRGDILFKLMSTCSLLYKNFEKWKLCIFFQG